MTDIVERLLHMVPVDILGGRPMLLNPDGPAAVHEIDQLRNEIINLRAGASVMQEELNNQEDLNDSWREENEGLKAEIERLRAALEEAAFGLGETDLAKVGRYAQHIARAALEGK